MDSMKVLNRIRLSPLSLVWVNLLANAVLVDAFMGISCHVPKKEILSINHSRRKSCLYSSYQSLSNASFPISTSESEPESESESHPQSKTKRLSVVLRETNKKMMNQTDNNNFNSICDNQVQNESNIKQREHHSSQVHGNSFKIKKYDSIIDNKNSDSNTSTKTNTDSITNTYTKFTNSNQDEDQSRKIIDTGPYADFSVQELLELSESLLCTKQSQSTEPSEICGGEIMMTRQQLHEASRLMSSWSKRRVEQSGIMTEKLLNRVINETIRGNEKCYLTPIMFHMSINAWLNCGSNRNPYRAGAIFERMILLYEEEIKRMNGEQTFENMHFPKPNIAICNVVIESLAKCKTKKAALQCESILSKMEEIAKLVEESPSTQTSSTVTISNSTNNVHMGNDAEMERVALTSASPNIRTYNAVMNAWAQSRLNISGESSETILMKVRELYQSTKNPFLQPNQKSFNIAIHSWAKCSMKGSAKRAEQILQMMEKDFESGKNKNVRPDNISYTSVLTAWANSREKESARRAEEILGRLERLYFEQNDVDEWGLPKENKNEWPDTISYNAVLNVYAKSEERDAGERCEKLFQKMEYLYHMGNENVKPDLVSYNSLINVMATNPGTPAAAHRAGEILEQMEKLYKAGDESVKPDVVTYNSVIKAYSNSRDAEAAKTAETILNRMEAMYEEDEKNVQPDSYTYNTVIHCWANSGDDSAAQKAELLLHQMAKKYANGNSAAKPTVVSYNSVLNALSKSKDSDAPYRSERILKHMIELYNTGDVSVKPDVFSFCTVINTWSKSKALDKASRAERNLRKMQKMNVRPNTFVYTAVLNACAHTFGDERMKRNAMEMAVGILEELRLCKHCHANHVTYATFFKACSNLIHRNRNALLELIWRQAVSEGQIGAATLAQFERAGSRDLYISMVGDYLEDGEDFVSINELPKEWICNVREKRHRKRSLSKK